MLQEVWKLIQSDQFELANQKLDLLKVEGDYLKNVVHLLKAELALKQEEFVKCIEWTNQALSFFSSYTYYLNHLDEDPSGLGISCLEQTFIYWLYARALVGQQRWNEAETFAKKALDGWNFYRLARQPFLSFPTTQWNSLPKEMKSLWRLTQQKLNQRVPWKENLDFLVPDHFQAKPFAPKFNHLPDQPFVSVCIASYNESFWLKLTIDSLFAQESYQDFEVIIILQKKDASDPSGDFLQNPPYANNPKLKVHVYDHPLGADNAKQIGYEQAQGELILSLDGHVIVCPNLISRTVQIFLKNREVSILGYGLAVLLDTQTLTKAYFFDEVPRYLNGIITVKPIIEPLDQSLIYRPGLYHRHTLMGAAFCITRELFQEVGGYLLKDQSWGDKTLGMCSYLCGYQLFTASELVCIHKWISEPLPFEFWKGYHPIWEYAISSLVVGYVYYSESYFNDFLVPWVKYLCADNFDFQWQKFEERIPYLDAYKKAFWQKAVRTTREYWLEYGDYIWSKLEEKDRAYLGFV